jgi:hypothetical protein
MMVALQPKQVDQTITTEFYITTGIISCVLGGNKNTTNYYSTTGWLASKDCKDSCTLKLEGISGEYAACLNKWRSDKCCAVTNINVDTRYGLGVCEKAGCLK